MGIRPPYRGQISYFIRRGKLGQYLLSRVLHCEVPAGIAYNGGVMNLYTIRIHGDIELYGKFTGLLPTAYRQAYTVGANWIVYKVVLL
jgi:hypothetical protein